jgi:hypothetical protein
MKIANEIKGFFYGKPQLKSQSVNDPAVAASAQRFYSEHISSNRPELINRCATHLVEGFAISTRAAEDIAMQVFSEIHNAGAHAFIDLERSTSQMIVLHDSALRANHMITVSDLLQLIRTPQTPQNSQ